MPRLSDSVRRLTPEQQKLVEDNVGLAYRFCELNRPPLGMDWDEWVAECLHILCMCSLSYDKSKAKFSTYVWNSFIHQRSKVGFKSQTAMRDIRRTQQLSEVDADSLQAKPDKDMAEIRDEYQWCLSVLSLRNAGVLAMHCHGKFLKDIGKDLGISKQRTEQIYNGSIRNIRIKRGIKVDPAYV